MIYIEYNVQLFTKKQIANLENFSKICLFVTMKLKQHICSLHEKMADLTDYIHVLEYINSEPNRISLKEHYLLTLHELWRLSSLSEKELTHKYKVFVEYYYSARDFFEMINENSAQYASNKIVSQIKSMH